MDRLTISKDLLQGILNYLALKPYGEVYMLIAEIQAQAAASPVPTEKPVVATEPDQG